MRLCYYLTSHGLGHSVRACTVCEQLPGHVTVHFRTSVPERFFREELDRPFTWSEASFDCGCLQSDSVTVDITATVARYREIARRNRTLLDSEAAWLRREHFDTVVCDIPAFPLAAARAAGVPAIALGNFTWHDIYAEYAADLPEFGPVLAEMERQYAAADLLVEAAPALPMPYFRRRTSVGIIGRTGADVGEQLRRELGIASSKRLALIYLGTFGLDLPWERLAHFRDWVFLSADPLPSAPDNCRVLDRTAFRFRDIAASVDLVVGKLGYCTVAGCMVNRVPLLYVPRRMFAEYPALERAVDQWGHGRRLDEGRFRALDWGEALDVVRSLGRPAPAPGDGARRAAEGIVKFARERSRVLE